MKQANGCLSIIAHIYRTYSKIYIKIPRGYDSFEPDLSKPIRGDKLASKIQIDLDAMLQIVKILKLNEKIWTS